MVRKYYKYTMILWILKADDDEFEKDSKDSELDCDSDNQLIYYYVHSSGYIKKKNKTNDIISPYGILLPLMQEENHK